jgi:TRAP-type C4-dicarboxylate transport system permease small subunit
MKILRYINQFIAKAENGLIIISLGLMVFLTFLQVILRALYTHGNIQLALVILSRIEWSDILSRLLVLWITFLGASLITSENRHIRIDLLGVFLPRKLLSFRELILSVACMLICSLMLYASIGYIRMEMDFGSNLFLNIPSWACQIIMPIGFLMILFRFFIITIEQFLEIIRGDRA